MVTFEIYAIHQDRSVNAWCDKVVRLAVVFHGNVLRYLHVEHIAYRLIGIEKGIFFIYYLCTRVDKHSDILNVFRIIY